MGQIHPFDLCAPAHFGLFIDGLLLALFHVGGSGTAEKISLGLVPGQPIALFGAEVLAIGLVVLVVALRNQLPPPQLVEGVTQFKILVRALVCASVALPLVVGGIQLLLGLNSGLYLAGIGVLIALAAGVWNAWVLLVEIMR